MHHQFDVVFNRTTGLTFPGAQVQVFDGASLVDIFADNSGTPIASVSGIANTAVADANANYSFYVPPGKYTLVFSYGSSILLTVPDEQLGSVDDALGTSTTVAPSQNAVAGGFTAAAANLAASTGAGLIGLSQANSYTAGTVGAILHRQKYNPMDAPWLAAGDGTTDDTTAVSACATASAALGRPMEVTGNHRITANTTLTCDLMAASGGFTVDASRTLTLTGIMTADLDRVFYGSGSVVGLRYARPEWFGAVRNGTTDDSAAVQKAHDCVEGAYAAGSKGFGSFVELAQGVYGVAAPIKLRPTANNNLKFLGQGVVFGGTRFQVLSTFSNATGAMALLVDGNANAIQKITSMEIGNFGIIPYTAGASTCTIGMQVGNNALDLIGLQQSQIRDVYVSDGFPTGLRLGNFRLIDFNRVSVWNRSLAASTCVQFFSDTSASFCGDTNFNSCQFVSNTSANGVDFSISVAASQVKGVRFNSCTFYYANKQVIMSPSAAALVGDIWFNAGCQFDGQQNNVIYARPTGSNTVLDDIHIDGCYIRGVNAGYNAIDMGALSSAKMRAIWITDNWFANIVDGSRAIQVQDASNIHVDRNSLTECNSTTAEMILFGQNVRSFTCNGNTLDQDTAITVKWLVTLGTGCDYGSMVNNSANGAAATAVTRNLSAGTHLTTTPNW